MRQLITGAAMTVALAVAGCGVGEKILAKADVEEGSKNALTKSVGIAPESVSCPEDLDAKVGASERCTLTDDQGNKLGMTVSVKKLKDDQATYEVAVDGS